MVGGGAALGVLFGIVRSVRVRRFRLGLSLLMGAALVGGLAYWLGLLPEIRGLIPQHKVQDEAASTFGIFLLLGLPVFYLLTFAGQQEESEVEVGAMCATLGLGLALVTEGNPQMRSLAYALPLVLYFWYTLKVLPGLRVFKYVLRGISHASVGRYRPALLAFRRALQLDPNNQTAREEFWHVHVSLDFRQLAGDAELLALVDFNLCIERAGSLLLQGNPGPHKLADAHRLLDLVLNQRPHLKPAVAYWRAVALVHEHRLDEAVVELDWLLDPAPHDRQQIAEQAARRSVLLQAWLLVLMVHDELRRRVGVPQWRCRAGAWRPSPPSSGTWPSSPTMPMSCPSSVCSTRAISEEEFRAGCDGDNVPGVFDYAYVQHLGSTLLEDAARWQRGVEYLPWRRGACPHWPPRSIRRFRRSTNRPAMATRSRRYLEGVKKAGQAVGQKNLADAERVNYFKALRRLGEDCMARDDVDGALDNFRLYAEYERAGVETLRTMATLYEQKEDALAALRITDRALVYNAKDKDLLDARTAITSR